MRRPESGPCYPTVCDNVLNLQDLRIPSRQKLYCLIPLADPLDEEKKNKSIFNILFLKEKIQRLLQFL